jgi:pimeloyl-ACP methyl ester carboxylesterase
MPSAAGLYYFSHFEEEKNLPPVILIHGAGGNCLHWPPSIRRLPGMRIFAPDLPGHGKSEGIGRQSIRDYASAILDLMRALTISKAVFVGHSMGAAIALHLAIHKPRHVLALGLLGAGARMPVSPELLDNSASAATLPLALKFIEQHAYDERTDRRIRAQAMQQMATVRPTVLHGDFLACSNFDEFEAVARVRAPSLIICGDEDQFMPLRYSEYLAATMKNARLLRVERAGHMVMLDKPDIASAALAEFIQKVPYQPGGAS